MTISAIHLNQLTRAFGYGRALDPLSLQVPAGVICGFLGPNGAGKTTTINLLLGLLEPTEGRAEVLGFDTCPHANEVHSARAHCWRTPACLNRCASGNSRPVAMDRPAVGAASLWPIILVVSYQPVARQSLKAQFSSSAVSLNMMGYGIFVGRKQEVT